MFKIISCLLLFAGCVCGQIVSQVDITQGTVEGSLSDDGNFFEFYGIPYAGSVVGRRFQEPPNPTVFNGIFVANQEDIKCVRPLGVGYEGVEDCLVANIFTPVAAELGTLPVMVWIKGSEFDRAEEPPISFRNIVENDIVVVTLNYRESIFGFLCLGTESAPGNAGLKDILAGLRWVQNNIAMFGGNPNNVTIVGHGSGAAAVDLITLSPLSEGLFGKAILQSGTALSPWAVTREPTRYAIEVAEALGHVLTDIDSLVDVLSRASVASLMAAINDLDLYNSALSFAPCIENENLDDDNQVLILSPYETINQGNITQIPMLIGFTEYEGTIKEEKAESHGWLELMNSSFIHFIQSDLEFENDEERENIALQIRSFYFNESSIDMDSIEGFITYFGDIMISIAALREANLRALTSAETYVYQFSYNGLLGEQYSSSMGVIGAGHGEELGYLFSTVNATDSDIDIVASMVERWSNFIKTGLPTKANSSTVWEPVSPTSSNIILFRNSEYEDDPYELALTDVLGQRVNFWDSIYDLYFNDAVGKWSSSDREDDEVDITTDDPLNTGTTEASEDSITTEMYVEENGNESENASDSSAQIISSTLVILIASIILF